MTDGDQVVFRAAVLSLTAGLAQAATVLHRLNVDPQPFDFRIDQDGLRLFNIAKLGPLGQSFSLDQCLKNLQISAVIPTLGSSASVTAQVVDSTGLGVPPVVRQRQQNV